MIKINLLPSHILEGRKVKFVIALMALFVVLVALGMAAWVWAPAPFSLTAKKKVADAELERVTALATAVTTTQTETANEIARTQAQSTWVAWVTEAAGKPAQWIRYYKRLNDFIPEDVVVTALPVPNGTNLTISGYTSDLRAATRWYLNMLRSDLVDPSTGGTPVQFQPNPLSWPPGPVAAGTNPRMATQVTMQIQLNPANPILSFQTPVAAPAAAGASGSVGGRGGGGARMGGRGGGGGGGGGGMGRGGGGGGGGGMGRGGGGGGMGRGGGGGMGRGG